MAAVTKLESIIQNLPETETQPHFHKTAYKVRKKIFCTLDLQAGTAVVKLDEIDQAAFCSFDLHVIRPVQGAWGKMGWTEVMLEKVRDETLIDILKTAYRTVAPAKLGAMVK